MRTLCTSKRRGRWLTAISILCVALPLELYSQSSGTNCLPAPAGQVGWWQGEGDAKDIIGGNDGTLISGASYGTGEVGQAFVFTTTGDGVMVPANPNLDVGQGPGFTVECWINPLDLTQRGNLVEWNTGDTSQVSPYGVHIQILSPGELGLGAGNLFADVHGADGSMHWISAPGGTLTTGVFQHVSLTYDKSSGIARLFRNGAIVAQTGLGSYTPQTSYDLYFGLRPAGGGVDSLTGTLDEIGLYNRALSPAEIQGIYNAGQAGKCVLPSVPFIVLQPTNQTVTVGQSATFSVFAMSGALPMTYQWKFSGTDLDGQTSDSLTLTNVQYSQAGGYSVVVSDDVGSVTSSIAVLRVVFPPAPISVVSTNLAPSGMITVPIQIVANGNENALGFSLNFDTTKLIYANATLGNGASGVALMPNTSLINSGKLGLALALPPGATFPAGTQQVVQVTFGVVVPTSTTSTTLSFGDQPTPRQLWDTDLGSLAATYASGTVTVAAATNFEGDVFPRPNGDKSTTLSDWLQMGRYVARLDYPTNAAEFQRADCAPRSTLGDGAIKVTDWVQVGRYASGLDPLTPSGGPTNEVVVPGTGPSVTRLVTASGAALLPGQITTVSVSLAAQGNENALSFSLAFDPVLARFAGATVGGGAAGATLFVNTNQTGSGKVGFALALGTGTSFAAGTREVVRLTFQTSSSSVGSFSPSFTDQPVPREISDAGALALPASYVNSTITIGAPALRIAQSGQNVCLAWPLWATNFGLQACDGALSAPWTWTNCPVVVTASNNETVVVLPANGARKFYRLYHP